MREEKRWLRHENGYRHFFFWLEILQLVSISLTETICLKDLFAKPNCKIVNELDGSTESTLF